jgi:hypothetical protein
MDDAFRADALTLAIEAEVENFLIWMLPADLIVRYAAHEERATLIGCPIGVFTNWLPFVRLFLGPVLDYRNLRLLHNSFRPIIWRPWLCIRSRNWGLIDWD